MAFFNLINSGFIFSAFSFQNNIRIVNPDHRFIGRNNNNVKSVDFLEFLFFCFSSTSHAGKFFIHAEIVLEGNSCQSLAFTLNFNAFFSFNSLVQAFRKTTAKHQPTGKFINNDNFAVFYDIIFITMHNSFGLQSTHQLMREVNAMLSIIHVFYAQHFFSFSNTDFSGGNCFQLFINSIIFPFIHFSNYLSQNFIQISRFFARSGDNKRSSRFINQNTVNFIDNTII